MEIASPPASMPPGGWQKVVEPEEDTIDESTDNETRLEWLMYEASPLKVSIRCPTPTHPSTLTTHHCHFTRARPAPYDERPVTHHHLPTHLPLTAHKMRWDMVIMLCILYSAIAVPMRLCFRAEAEGAMLAFEATMSLVFLTDLALAFNTAYLVDGDYITDRRLIAKRYLRGWFCVDAPSSLPVELIEIALPSANAAWLPVFRILRMLRLVRMLRLLKISGVISRAEEQFEISLRPLRVVELVVQLLFISHLLACCWFTTTWFGGDVTRGDELTWIEVYDDGSAADGPVSRQYYFSFYWAMTTLFAQNPIKPGTDGERNFQMCVSLLNRLLLAYVIGRISSLISQLDRQAAMVSEKLDSLKEYLHFRGTPKELAIRVKRYYEHLYERTAVYDERACLAGLTPSLRRELVYSHCTNTILRIPIFSQLSVDFLAEIFMLVKPLTFERGETIYSRGAASNDLLLLLEGEVDMLTPAPGGKGGMCVERRVTLSEELLLSPTTGEVLVAVDGSGCFGQEALLGMRRRCTAMAHVQVNLLIIEKPDLLKLFKQAGENLVIDLRKICNTVLAQFMARERLARTKIKLYRGILAKQRGERARRDHAELGLLLAYRRHRDRFSLQHDELYKIISKEFSRKKERVGDPPTRQSVGDPSTRQSVQQPATSNQGPGTKDPPKRHSKQSGTANNTDLSGTLASAPPPPEPFPAPNITAVQVAVILQRLGDMQRAHDTMHAAVGRLLTKLDVKPAPAMEPASSTASGATASGAPGAPPVSDRQVLGVWDAYL